MRSAAARVLLLWLALMAAGVAVVANSRFSADMSFFLPSRPSVKQTVLVDQLQDGMVSRLLMVAIAGGDEQARGSVSRALRERLGASASFVAVQNGEAGGLEGEREFFLSHRYVLSPSVNPERFTEAGLADAVAQSIELLASPMGLLLKPYLARDPTGEMLAMLNQLSAGGQPEMRDGVWSSRDGERAMLLLETRAPGSDTDGQASAMAEVEAAFDQLRASPEGRDLSLQLSGPGRFAVQARETIKAEVSRMLLISTLGIVAVLLWVYRSGRLLALGLLPVLSGALAGVVVVSLVHGTVFGITVGFGSALIGEAVDYAIYFFVQSGRVGLASWRQTFWPTIRLGVLTSSLGFAALLLSGFPGLSQLGLYALSGVVTAALVTRFVLPTLSGGQVQVPAPGRWVSVLLSGVQRAHRLQGLVLVLGALAAGYLWMQRDALWDANLSALSTVTVEDARADSRMRADLAAPDARYLVLVSGSDQESALRAAEQAGDALDGLVDQGLIGGYDSPARFLPSEQRQQARLDSLPDSAVLKSRLQRALVDSPLSSDKLGPFLDDVRIARERGLMHRSDLDGSALALAVDSMLTRSATGWNVMLPLRPAPGAEDADIPTTLVQQKLAASGALVVDMKTEFDALYGGYLDEAVMLSLAGLALIVALLAFTLRSPRRLLRVLLTLVLTVVFVVAGLTLAGERLHLLHLIGMLLVVAVGSNYALFFDRTAGGEALDTPTLMSMVVATLTTAIGFGALALSSVPVLHAVGALVGPGAILALLLAAVLVYPRGSA
jgi:predicted exporter